MKDYKEEIQQTRQGSLGSSDGAMLCQIANLGYIPQSAKRRLAIVKGLVENTNITSTAMAFGDYIENQIYDHLVKNDTSYESNPLWVSKKYSREHVRLIAHPDIVKIDNDAKTISIWECKATKYNPKATKGTYRSQMFIQWTIAKELASEYGRDWRVHIYLCHYDTNGIDLENEQFTFDTARLSIHKMAFSSTLFDLGRAMDITNEYLSVLDEYYDGDEIDSNYLPEKVRNEFDMVTLALEEIKEREKKVDDFKAKLYEFMLQKGIKSIKNESWSIVRVDETESKSFDGKRFIEDYKASHPRKGNELAAKYTKVVKRKGSVQIRLKNDKNKNI